MYKQIIRTDSNQLVLNLPDDCVGREVKVTAEPIGKATKGRRKYSLKENRKFYGKYRFGKLQIMYTRDELYDR